MTNIFPTTFNSQKMWAHYSLPSSLISNEHHSRWMSVWIVINHGRVFIKRNTVKDLSVQRCDVANRLFFFLLFYLFLVKILFYFFSFFFYCCSSTVVSIFPPLLPPTPAIPTSHPRHYPTLALSMCVGKYVLPFSGFPFYFVDGFFCCAEPF